MKRLGRQHPLIKTQYYLEEIDAEGGMFNSTRRNLMRGAHLRQTTPTEGKQYAILIDVAGEDEDAEGAEVREREPRKDSTAITVVEVDLSTLSDDILRAPTYRVVDRLLFTGTKHTQLYGRILALADLWNARYLVVDATGIGAGLTSFLAGALPTRVLPYLFTSKSSSDLGFGFLAVIDSGRFRDYAGTDELREQFERECGACQYEILDGPAHQMRWAVPDGARDPSTGELMHDDLLKSAALCWHLDSQIWPTGFASTVIQGKDPLAEIDRSKFK